MLGDRLASGVPRKLLATDVPTGRDIVVFDLLVVVDEGYSRLVLLELRSRSFSG